MFLHLYGETSIHIDLDMGRLSYEVAINQGVIEDYSPSVLNTHIDEIL